MEIPDSILKYSWENIKVYIRVKLHSDSNGDLLCSSEYIAEEVGMSIDDFRRHMNELRSLGFIPCPGEGFSF